MTTGKPVVFFTTHPLLVGYQEIDFLKSQGIFTLQTTVHCQVLVQTVRIDWVK